MRFRSHRDRNRPRVAWWAAFAAMAFGSLLQLAFTPPSPRYPLWWLQLPVATVFALLAAVSRRRLHRSEVWRLRQRLRAAAAGLRGACVNAEQQVALYIQHGPRWLPTLAVLRYAEAERLESGASYGQFFATPFLEAAATHGTVPDVPAGERLLPYVFRTWRGQRRSEKQHGGMGRATAAELRQLILQLDGAEPLTPYQQRWRPGDPEL